MDCSVIKKNGRVKKEVIKEKIREKKSCEKRIKEINC